jgi:predicted transcriptional regulator of viral defense system
MTRKKTQQDQALQLLRKKGILRSFEFAEAGVTAATLARLKAKKLIAQLQRGLYTLAESSPFANHEMAQVSKAVPHGVVCLVSALAFHELTTTIPGKLWIAIGPKDRRPKLSHPPLQIVRFPLALLKRGTDRHVIDGVPVRITNPARTIVDLFRYRRNTGLNLAIEGMREALRQRKATPAQIARCAEEAKVWKAIQPYLEAVTSRV